MELEGGGIKMKKLVSIAVLFMFLTTVQAQKDVTKFLGIPVDGYKPEMIQKLKEKGFRSSYDDPNILEGEFNGQDVTVHVVTNNNKVYRIALFDKNKVGETAIRIRFNRLCEQFSNNPKYMSFNNYEISEDENIAYEIALHDKRYEAVFYQKPAILESVDTLPNYTEEQIHEKFENMTEDEFNEFKANVVAGFDDVIESLNKSVWFMISNFRGEYYITMFYDNEYNKANGEDL